MAKQAYRIGFLLMPDFSYFGLVSAAQPLFLANWLSQGEVFQWKILSESGAPAQASNGMAVPVDASVEAAGEFDTVFVLASFEPKKQCQCPKVLNWLRRQARFGVEIGGIETGSEVLAAAGLLDGHEAAIHWDNLEGFQERYPDVAASANLFSVQRGRITCAGGSATIDMMLDLVARKINPGIAKEIAHQMIIPKPREAAAGQLQDSVLTEKEGNSIIEQVVALMQKTIEEPLTAEEITSAVGLSHRQLCRLFKRHMGTTLMRGYIMIRLAKAHKLLQQTDLSVTEVAVCTGFSSLEHFSRVYRSVFARPPSTDRRQAISAPVYRAPASIAAERALV